MWFKVVPAFFLLAFIPSLVHADQCLPLDDDQKARIIVYLSKWLDVPETDNLSIQSDHSFFLSADQRFLTGSLLDLTSDPREERKIYVGQFLVTEEHGGYLTNGNLCAVNAFVGIYWADRPLRLRGQNLQDVSILVRESVGERNLPLRKAKAVTKGAAPTSFLA